MKLLRLWFFVLLCTFRGHRWSGLKMVKLHKFHPHWRELQCQKCGVVKIISNK